MSKDQRSGEQGWGRGLPDYLRRHYWWAYLWRPALWFFDRRAVVNAILLGNYQRLVSATLARLNTRPGARTLQLSCVYGDLTPQLARHCRGELHVVDVAPGQLGLAARKLRNGRGRLPSGIHLARMNGESLGYADGAFDQVLIFFLLHEVPAASRRRILAEALRVLRPGGELLITEYGERARGHRLQHNRAFRALIGTLEPFALEFWDEDLGATLGHVAAGNSRRLAPARSEPVHGGLYRVTSTVVHVAASAGAAPQAAAAPVADGV